MSPSSRLPPPARDVRACVLPLWPHELSDMSAAGRRRRVVLLRRALRIERQRGVAGHWTYDLARHWALLAWYREEVAALDEVATASGHATRPRSDIEAAIASRMR
jgi:hypothetical protein